MDPSWYIPRRTLLKGALRGAAVVMGLPMLEAMVKPLYANEAAAAAKPPPVRFATFFFPNGVPPGAYKIGGATADLGELTPILKPLEANKALVNVISNTWHPLANQAGGDGHYFKDAPFLTGTTINKTTGADINVGGISLDQLLAQHVGHETRLPSIELGTEPPYSGVDNNFQITQVYGGHISWSSPTTPVAREINPAEAFDRLFSAHAEGLDPKAMRKPSALSAEDELSLLDVINADAKLTRNRLGLADQRKMDEYLQSVRDLERRIAHDIKESKRARPTPKEALASMPALFEAIKPWRSQKNYRNHDYTGHIRLLLDIMAMAFWTDQTRVATLMTGVSVSGRNFSFLDGVGSGHHDTSHHSNEPGKLAEYEKISTWQVEQFNYFIDRLKEMKEFGATVLDRSCVLFGSGLGDGNAHSGRDLPIILAGRGGGAFKTGRHIACQNGERLTNVFLEITRAMGLKLPAFGDSTGGLKALAG